MKITVVASNISGEEKPDTLSDELWEKIGLRVLPENIHISAKGTAIFITIEDQDLCEMLKRNLHPLRFSPVRNPSLRLSSVTVELPTGK